MGIYSRISLAFIKSRTKNIECEVYSKCSEMTLYNYEQYLQTGDKKWFTNEYSLIEEYKRKGISINIFTNKNIDDTISDFYNDMFSITKDNRVLDRYQRIHKIMCLEGKYNIVVSLLDILYGINNNIHSEIILEVIEELRKWGYKINTDTPLLQQLDSIRTRIQGIKTKIELIESEIKDDNIEEKANISQDCLNIVRCLELNFKIDLKNTTVKEYILLKEDAKKKIENEQRNR